MKTVITPANTFSEEFSHIMEFNIDIPELARTDISPVSEVEITELFRQPYHDVASDTDRDLVKLSAVHNLSYTNLFNQRKTLTTRHTTITSQVPLTDDTPVEYVATKVVDVLVPPGVSKVTNSTISNSPTSNPQKSRCAYSVFMVQNVPVPKPVNS